MDYGMVGAIAGGLLLNKLVGNKTTNNGSYTATATDAINVPGTIVGQLANSATAQQYMQNFTRYNNYTTWNYGAAQMAADRYMTLKERIPMSFEYYETPTQKKEVTMYINPEKLSVSTTKVKGKAYTRGGIYYNHYGDDHWTLSLHGTVGWSQMRGIEALEEIYHNSGTLLKYQNVNAATVHTNNVSGTAQDNQTLLDNLRNSDNPVQSYLGRVIGTATDFLGMTGQDTNSALNGGTPSANANANLFGAIVSGVGNANEAIVNAMGLSGGVKGVGGMVTAALASKELIPQIFGTLGGTTAKSLVGDIAADLATSLILGKASTANTQLAMSQTEFGLTNGFSGILNLLNGNVDGLKTSIMPQQATAGNYYNLGTLSVNELNKTITSVQAYNKAHTIDKQQASQSWSDIEDLLTDKYRPRQVFIYFDNRVFIGHFDSFNWDRSAAHPLIYYDLKFTVTRQVILTPVNQMENSSTNGGGASVKDVLIGTGVNMLLNGVFGKKSGSESTE